MHGPSIDITGASDTKPFLRLEGVTRRIGDLTILDSVNLAVEQGQFISLLGPSGCGKTTLLRILSGLSPCDEGVVHLAGVNLTRIPAHKRNMGVVFQNYALFPHLTVAENIAFGLKARRADRAAIAAIVDEHLAMVQLSHFADRPITSLSGGQQQRVAVARALATKPKLVLLDEPFSALDRKLRESMQIELRALLRRVNITAIFVTHDQDEALIMSDRIAVMNRGRIEDFAGPATIYARPRSLFTFDFVGLSTRINARVSAVDGRMLTLDTKYGPVRAQANFALGTSVVIGIRPESIGLASGPSIQPGDDANILAMRMTDAVFHGSKRHLHFAADLPDQVIAEVHPSAAAIPELGQSAHLSWRVLDTLVFPQ
jgi:putative spermidine/putrescine transport system ATP-binding protein